MFSHILEIATQRYFDIGTGPTMVNHPHRNHQFTIDWLQMILMDVFVKDKLKKVQTKPFGNTTSINL